MGTQKKIHLFCEGLRQINRPIFYKINFRAKTIARLGPDFMRYMKENGLINIFIGLESGNNDTLRLFNKKTTMETNLLATDILQKVSIPFRNGFIMFHPYSTLKEYKNNIGFINCIHQGYRLGNYLEMFLLYKGCDLYTKVKKDNLITDDYTIKNLYGYTFQDPQISCLYNIFQTVLKTHRTTTYMGVKFIERCDVLDDMIAKLDILSQGENFDLRQQFINIKTKVNEEYYQYFDMVYNFVNSKKDCEICYTPISKRTLLDGIADLDALTLYIENKLAIYPSFL